MEEVAHVHKAKGHAWGVGLGVAKHSENAQPPKMMGPVLPHQIPPGHQVLGVIDRIWADNAPGPVNSCVLGHKFAAARVRGAVVDFALEVLKGHDTGAEWRWDGVVIIEPDGDGLGWWWWWLGTHAAESETKKRNGATAQRQGKKQRKVKQCNEGGGGKKCARAEKAV